MVASSGPPTLTRTVVWLSRAMARVLPTASCSGLHPPSAASTGLGERHIEATTAVWQSADKLLLMIRRPPRDERTTSVVTPPGASCHLPNSWLASVATAG